jgi:hypothetical protein
MYAVLNHMQDPSEKIAMLSLSLLATVSSQDEEFPVVMAGVVGEGRIERALGHASMKLTTQSRIMAVQVGNNFMLSGVILLNLVVRWLENALTEKTSVKIELSFFFAALVRQADPELLASLVNHHRLAHVLQTYCQSGSNEEIKSNGLEGMRTIGQRLYKQNHVVREICRGEMMRDESEDVTGEHEPE